MLFPSKHSRALLNTGKFLRDGREPCTWLSSHGLSSSIPARWFPSANSSPAQMGSPGSDVAIPGCALPRQLPRGACSRVGQGCTAEGRAYPLHRHQRHMIPTGKESLWGDSPSPLREDGACLKYSQVFNFFLPLF